MRQTWLVLTVAEVSANMWTMVKMRGALGKGSTWIINYSTSLGGRGAVERVSEGIAIILIKIVQHPVTGSSFLYYSCKGERGSWKQCWVRERVPSLSKCRYVGLPAPPFFKRQTNLWVCLRAGKGSCLPLLFPPTSILLCFVLFIKSRSKLFKQQELQLKIKKPRNTPPAHGTPEY